MSKFLIGFGLFVLGLLALVGCGGSGGGDDNGGNVPTTPVTFQLGWGARSRLITGPSSALSATITLGGALRSGGDLIETVDRTADPAAYTATYTSSAKSKLGTFPLTVRFYSQPKGVGDVVAVGQASVTIAANGTGIGNIAVAKTVASVQVAGGQIVPSGGSLALAAIVRDADGALIAITPGSAVWSVVSGGTNLSVTPDGTATAIRAGVENVRVVVDGVASAPGGVTVAQAALASLAVDPGQAVPAGQPRQLTFSGKDADGNPVAVSSADVQWELVSGSSVLSLTPKGLATALSNGSATVRVSVNGIQSPAVAVTASAPTFADPSFEAAPVPTNDYLENEEVTGTPWTGVANWGIADGDSPWGRSGHTGPQHAYLQAFDNGTSQGEIRQTVNGLIAGRTYRVTFWIARRNGGFGADNGTPVKAFVGTTEVLAATAPPTDTTWLQVTTNEFVAPATSITFRIQSQLPTSQPGDRATLVDDVALAFVR